MGEKEAYAVTQNHITTAYMGRGNEILRAIFKDFSLKIFWILG